MRSLFLLPFVVAFLASSIAMAQASQSLQVLPMPSGYGALPQSVVAQLEQTGLSAETLGVHIEALDNGQTLLSHHAQRSFVPASTQKLITTAAALDVLGADFVWQTGIYSKGVLIDGVLYGDLIIKGSGDPALSHERLSSMLATIHQKIKHITGNIIIDDGRFVDVRYDPNAFDGLGHRPYNAYPSAFLVNFGTVEVRFSPSGRYEGEHFISSDNNASVAIFPKLDIPYPKTITTSTNCALPAIKKSADALLFSGTFGAGCGIQSAWINFADNQTLATKAIDTGWRTLDTKFSGKVLIQQEKIATTLPLMTIASESLAKQIWRINQFSNNVMTEQVALSLPIYALDQPISTYPKAQQFLNHWFVMNIKQPAPTISRASGLCTDCRITPKAMMGLLGYMYRHPSFNIYKDSLPIAGESGTMATLSKRHPNHPAIGRAWIKTGTLNDVTAMAGYVKGQSGQMYGFVAIVNGKGVGYNGKATRVLDELLAWTAQH